MNPFSTIPASSQLILALSKGRIFEDTLPLLASAGITVLENPETSRKLILDNASKRADKFLDLSHGESPSGQPLFDEALAWIDCRIESVVDIGDHHLVVGRVEALELFGGDAPLLFHRGSYHSSVALDR